MYVEVCWYVCIHVCKYVCTHIYKYLSKSVYVCICAYINACMDIYVYKYACAQMYWCMYVEYNCACMLESTMYNHGIYVYDMCECMSFYHCGPFSM